MFRFDAEYFQKRYLENDKTLKRFNWKFLESTVESIKSFGAYSLTNEITYLDEGIPFLRGQNIKNGTVDFSNTLFIDHKANALLWKSEVTPRMVLLTMSGSVGASSVAMESWNYPVNSNQDIAKITTTSEVNPFYLSALLESKYGKLQMERLPVGSVQQHTFIWQLEKLVIPLLTKEFQNKIEETVNRSYATLKQSKALYAEAENLLLDELGLRDWSPSDDSISVKSFAESFNETGRLDAEYYQPKYDELFALIDKNAERVGSFQTFNQRGVQPIYEFGNIKVINSKHILEKHLDYDNFESTTFNQWKENKDAQVFQNDILIYTTGANVGRTNVYLNNDDALASNHVNILRLEKGYSPIYVSCVLNSIIGRMQTKRIVTGTAQAELYPSAIAQFVVPFVAEQLQIIIADKIKFSFATQKQSKGLLEIAKRAVEMAIEESEDAAVEWMTARRAEN